jgi:prepilin-type N-terminal cleavage/methylation domain-containing protein
MNHFRRTAGQRGFTMMELMMVVVIVGILVAIAIPLYSNYVRNARVTEATGRIGEIITAAKAWAQEHQNATGNPVWPDATTANDIMDMSATDNFNYTILSTGGDATTTAFVVQATGIAGGKMACVTVLDTVLNITSTGNPPAVTFP